MQIRARQTVMFGPPPEPLEVRPAWWDIPVPELPPSELGLERARGLLAGFARRDRRLLEAIDRRELSWSHDPHLAQDLSELRELAEQTWQDLLALEGGQVESLELPRMIRRLKIRHMEQTEMRQRLLHSLSYSELEPLLLRERDQPVSEWDLQQVVTRSLFVAEDAGEADQLDLGLESDEG